MQSMTLKNARRDFHDKILADVMTVDANGVLSNADKDNRISRELAAATAAAIGAPERAEKRKGQESGKRFEIACRNYIEAVILRCGMLRPGRWIVEGGVGGIARFEQYAHLASLQELVGKHAELAAALGK